MLGFHKSVIFYKIVSKRERYHGSYAETLLKGVYGGDSREQKVSELPKPMKLMGAPELQHW